jgi:hypothetical protein
MKSMQRAVGMVLLACGFIFTVAIWGTVLAGKKEPAFLENDVSDCFLDICRDVHHSCLSQQGEIVGCCN